MSRPAALVSAYAPQQSLPFASPCLQSSFCAPSSHKAAAVQSCTHELGPCIITLMVSSKQLQAGACL
eukprot:1161392-Pelagomonas_calceolata.AAC.23